MTSSHPTPAPCQWFSRLVAALDRRSAPRLLLLLLGALFARGRRTVTSWFRAAGITDRVPPPYTALWAAGRRPTARGHACSARPQAADASGPRRPSAVRPRRHPDRPLRARTCRAPASTTTPAPARPARSSSTATSGSSSPGWPATRCGTRCPCRCAPCCTSAPRTYPGWPRRTPGSSAPSWSWPPSWSAGCGCGWATRARPCGW